MDDQQYSAPVQEEEQPQADTTAVVYPPKYSKPDEPANVWVRSLTSLAIYMLAGYYLFGRWQILLIITLIVVIHELGHFIAMKAFGYRDLGIFFIPLLGAYASGTKREVSQRQSAVILLAGPLPGILIGIAFCLLERYDVADFWLGISVNRIGLLFIFLNLINLLPVYPLDGGQLLNRVFLDEESLVSKIFVLLSAGMMCWFVWVMYNKTHHASSLVFLLFPLSLILRHFSESRISHIEKKVESAGINTDTEYENLPDKDYWEIRNILIEDHPLFKDVAPSPPYEYSAREERIMNMVQSLLHRQLIQDATVFTKLMILVVWAAAIASPWLLQLDMDIFHQLGF